MKRIITLSIVSAAVLLAGCTGEQEKCIKAVSDANGITKDRLEKQYTVMAKGLESQDAAVRITSQMWFAMLEKSANLIDPSKCSDSTLQWAQLLLPTTTNILSIVQSNKTARHSSDNAVRMQEVNMGAVKDVAVKGIDAAAKDPVIVEPFVVEVPTTP